MQERHMFSNADLKRLLLPLIIEQLLNSLMGTVDTIMVSNVGAAAMSAVSLVDSINVLFIQAFSALAAGGCIICSQYVGRNDLKTANRAAKQLLLVVFSISMVITGVCLLTNVRLLRLVFGKVEADVMEAAVTYFSYTSVSFPFIALYSAGAAIYRAQGNSRRPMNISILSNLINIAGNAILIWGIRMGVAGVAIATLTSRAFCAIVVLRQLHKPGQMITIEKYHEIRPDRNLIGKVLGLGIPAGIENSMFQFGKLMIQSTVSAMGTVAIAAQAMTGILEGLSGVAASAVGSGLVTVVGQCMGAGECGALLSNDFLDYCFQADRLGGQFYGGTGYQSRWRCEIRHGGVHCIHVDLPCQSLYFSGKIFWNGSHGGVDRNVCGLGSERYLFLRQIPQQKMAEA